mmetsp:Transcript_13708/g.32482  ORF Transcript_13708/g.32482 Transcript_13708/m.32482 type:complete len:230 (+) Transcript_13708:487-1176(+)
MHGSAAPLHTPHSAPGGGPVCSQQQDWEPQGKPRPHEVPGDPGSQPEQAEGPREDAAVPGEVPFPQAAQPEGEPLLRGARLPPAGHPPPARPRRPRPARRDRRGALRRADADRRRYRGAHARVWGARADARPFCAGEGRGAHRDGEALQRRGRAPEAGARAGGGGGRQPPIRPRPPPRSPEGWDASAPARLGPRRAPPRRGARLRGGAPRTQQTRLHAQRRFLHVLHPP